MNVFKQSFNLGKLKKLIQENTCKTKQIKRENFQKYQDSQSKLCTVREKAGNKKEISSKQNFDPVR